jgi:hypothetical protein
MYIDKKIIYGIVGFVIGVTFTVIWNGISEYRDYRWEMRQEYGYGRGGYGHGWMMRGGMMNDEYYGDDAGYYDDQYGNDGYDEAEYATSTNE